ncbi:MAG: antibiotic biosynthesis monooxygenase family protein [Nitrososphaeraceae archaeon]
MMIYMIKLGEIDKYVTFKRQLEEDIGPFVLINSYSVDPKEVDEFLKAFAAVSEAFKHQPGYISVQLHRGIAGSGTFVNYSVWEFMAEYRETFTNDEVRASLTKFPPNTVAYPHLFTKVAVPGICVG